VCRAPPPVGDEPRGLAVGSDAVWGSNEFDETLALIDPRANNVKRRLQLFEAASGSTAGMLDTEGR
jgi:hypothetical protein